MPQTHAPRGPIKARSDNPMDSPDPMEGRCRATNRQGNRCGKAPIAGGTVCRMHGGSAPQVKEAAMERLRALQHPAIDALSWLITQRDFPSAAMSAARDVMDRTEGRAPESMDLHITGELEVVGRKLDAARLAARQRNTAKA